MSSFNIRENSNPEEVQCGRSKAVAKKEHLYSCPRCHKTHWGFYQLESPETWEKVYGVKREKERRRG